MATLAASRRFQTQSASPRKNALHWLAGILGLAVLAFGAYRATQSELFLLHTVTVTPLSEGYPLSNDQLVELAHAPIGKVSLFDLQMEPIKQHLMKNPWVKGVVLGKQFPSTLSLTVIERTPVALLTENNGRVLYLEDDGTTFEDQKMVYAKDLPILTGFSAQNIDLLKKANAFLVTWFSQEHFPGLKVSSLSYDEKLGLRAVISVQDKNQKQMRMVVELGLNVEEASQVPYQRFKKVLEYLSSHAMQASKIWLGDGKKIVVKVLKDS
jgi:hypothetical protein